MSVEQLLINSSLDARGRLGTKVIQACAAQFANFHTGTGQPRMVREYVKVINPKTPGQVQQQNKLKLAVQAWQSATPEQKAEAMPLAQKKQISVYMAFVSIFIKNYQPAVGVQWDNGASIWDSGATVWLE